MRSSGANVIVTMAVIASLVRGVAGTSAALAFVPSSHRTSWICRDDGWGCEGLKVW